MSGQDHFRGTTEDWNREYRDYQAVVQQRQRIERLEAALVDLYDGASTFARYQHKQYHTGDYETCHRGICPGVRGMLRQHQDLVQTAVRTPVIPE